EHQDEQAGDDLPEAPDAQPAVAHGRRLRPQRSPLSRLGRGGRGGPERGGLRRSEGHLPLHPQRHPVHIRSRADRSPGCLPGPAAAQRAGPAAATTLFALVAATQAPPVAAPPTPPPAPAPSPAAAPPETPGSARVHRPSQVPRRWLAFDYASLPKDDPTKTA